MNRTAAVAAVVAAISAGFVAACKKKPTAREQAVDEMIAMRRFVDQMCRCEAGDRVCADKVQEQLTRWAADNPQTLKAKPADDDGPRLGTQYGECRNKAMGAAPTLPVPPDASVAAPRDLVSEMGALTDKVCACRDRACIDAATTELLAWSKQRMDAKLVPQPEDAARMAALSERMQRCFDAGGAPSVIAGFPAAPTVPLRTADEIIQHTYNGLTGFAVGKLELSYVHADGTLDPAYSKASIRLGRSRTALEDDPSRPLGAPVPDPEAPEDVARRKCPDVTWNRGARAHTLRPCQLVDALPRPRCTIAEVWKQAIAKGAPAEGLAVLTYRRGSNASEPPYWSFVIDDVPRKYHLLKVIPDLCEVVAEKPL